MSEAHDASKLAGLMREQRELTATLQAEKRPDRQAILSQRLTDVRNQCIELVDTYFRRVLSPILRNRFPGNVSGLQADRTKPTSINVVIQFTQLLNDFFVQVLERFDDPFWQKHSAIELRNYASIAISNSGIRNALARRKKQIPLEDDDTLAKYEDQLACEFEKRFSESNANVDAGDALDVINRWEANGNGLEKEYARALRLFYIAGMSMEEVSNDLEWSLATAYRRRDAARRAVRRLLEGKN